ncbi:MAG: hypothetical protein HRF42_01720 [Candidatus Brocadia sp.]
MEYIDDSTGITTKRISFDEAEYKNETIKIMVDGRMKDNQDVTYREAFLAVSKRRPDLFTVEARTWQ